MQKQAPSIARIFVAAAFVLSCFALLLFLWTTFGGPTPFKSKSYRFTVYFPEATGLVTKADVRIGGVSVGNVESIELAPPEYRVNGKDVAAVEVELDPKFAPISADARAILRLKTVVGETYVELTSGTARPGEPLATISHGEAVDLPAGAEPAGRPLADGGSLGVEQTKESTQIDEIFNSFDEETRMAFRRWQRSAAVAIRSRKLSFSDAIGNLAPFITDASDTLEILATQERALRDLVRDAGISFEALSSRGPELTEAIRGQKNTFEALATQDEALAETIQILPTFQRETRATLLRMDEFRAVANPLIRDMIPVARELSPTLRSVRKLAPNLRNLFRDLDPLYRVSLRGLPALRDFLDGLAPVLVELDPFLADLTPILRYLEYQSPTITDFLAGPAVSLSGAADGLSSDPAPRHYLRQFSLLSTETLSLSPNRLATNRGHGYLPDGVLNGYALTRNGIFPQYDCKNTDYSPASQNPDEDEIRNGQSVAGVNNGQPPSATFAPCYVLDEFPGGGRFGDERAPMVFTDP